MLTSKRRGVSSSSFAGMRFSCTKRDFVFFLLMNILLQDAYLCVVFCILVIHTLTADYSKISLYI